MTKFYGIGVGPGDPELLTIKGLNALKAADIIIAPKARMKGESVARDIVEKVLDVEKEFIELEFPMTKDKDELAKRYRNAALLIKEKIEEGKVLAYLTIGDPLLYSTYIYLLNALKEAMPELVIKTIPGIAAYSATASRLNYSLAEKDERVCICPVPKTMVELREVIEQNDTVVIMKVAKKLPEVLELLEEMGLLKETVLGSRTGLEGEKLVSGAEGPFDVTEKEGYLSTLIVRNKK
ncbi:MAG: precorrin-2 C(20)-methyltransferase [Proteobacteria bacterium]|nr:precorrin-2 C(20)-methyltransferase [Pseudomonadota bacterium]